MPVYVYEHVKEPPEGCEKQFEIFQEFGSEHLKKCPKCGRSVRRLIVSANFSRDRLGHTTLKDMGFSKLVRRDKGVYEIEGAARDKKKSDL